MGFLDNFAPIAHWALRIAFASVFLYHGSGKLPPDGFAASMQFPILLGWLVALAELGAGVFVLLGGFLKDWMTRIGALLGIAVMIGAISLVHWPYGWGGENGMEFQVVVLLIGIYLFIKGNRVNDAGALPAPPPERADTV